MFNGQMVPASRRGYRRKRFVVSKYYPGEYIELSPKGRAKCESGGDDEMMQRPNTRNDMIYYMYAEYNEPVPLDKLRDDYDPEGISDEEFSRWIDYFVKIGYMIRTYR